MSIMVLPTLEFFEGYSLARINHSSTTNIQGALASVTEGATILTRLRDGFQERAERTQDARDLAKEKATHTRFTKGYVAN